MKFLYVARHNQRWSNDDEGSITSSLRMLGHEVVTIDEYQAEIREEGDVLLFHKWCDPHQLKRLEGKILRAFWYFDLVDFPDATLARRNLTRMNWMGRILPHVDLGFCTDGDWAARYPDKLRVLRQGVDLHHAKRAYTNLLLDKPVDDVILFTGITKGGGVRESFTQEMKSRYGERFCQVPAGSHGSWLIDRVQSASIVVAPDGPITPRYWSNRVYLMLGSGAFLLHPYIQKLSKVYKDGEHLVYYRDREDLHRLIAIYSEKGAALERARIAFAGLTQTLLNRTYVNRCADLCQILGEKINEARHIQPGVLEGSDKGR